MTDRPPIGTGTRADVIVPPSLACLLDTGSLFRNELNRVVEHAITELALESLKAFDNDPARASRDLIAIARAFDTARRSPEYSGTPTISVFVGGKTYVMARFLSTLFPDVPRPKWVSRMASLAIYDFARREARPESVDGIVQLVTAPRPKLDELVEQTLQAEDALRDLRYEPGHRPLRVPSAHAMTFYRTCAQLARLRRESSHSGFPDTAKSRKSPSECFQRIRECIAAQLIADGFFDGATVMRADKQDVMDVLEFFAEALGHPRAKRQLDHYHFVKSAVQSVLPSLERLYSTGMATANGNAADGLPSTQAPAPPRQM